MPEPTPTRTAPLVVHVPPPTPAIPASEWRMLCIVLIVIGVIAFTFAKLLGGSWIMATGIMTPFSIVLPAVIYLVAGGRDRTIRRTRERMADRHPECMTDPLITALSKKWKLNDVPPTFDEIQEALKRAREDLTTYARVTGSVPTDTPPEKLTVFARSDDRARILCFGEVDPPEVGEDYFEPAIITPTESLWRNLFWLVAAMVLLLWLVLDVLHVLPGWLPHARSMLGGMGYILVSGLTVLAVWIWRAMLRPRYYRFAPGVIQVLEYRFGRARPTIRSYPMDAGTWALLSVVRKRVTLILRRDGRHDKLAFAFMRRRREFLELAWRAMLSTAPSGPLSEEELVG